MQDLLNELVNVYKENFDQATQRFLDQNAVDESKEFKEALRSYQENFVEEYKKVLLDIVDHRLIKEYDSNSLQAFKHQLLLLLEQNTKFENVS